MYHAPVLAEIATRFLVTNPGGTYVDATLGGGGHTQKILEQLSQTGRVIGIDQDSDAIAESRKRFAGEERLDIVHANFSSIAEVIDSTAFKSVHGILMDLGISSHQIDSTVRGFSFKSTGPLDMRMDARQAGSAADFLNTADADSIQNVIRRYGEEKQSRRIAQAIVNARLEKPLDTTEDLRAVIEQAVSPVHLNKTLARVFQAIRIYVNDELSVLERTLNDVYPYLCQGGRMVVISYHSLEDRIVKQFFRDIVTEDPNNPYRSTKVEQRFTLINKKPVIPDEDEISRNPRARSARLRAAEKK